MTLRLLSVGNDAKTVKGEQFGWWTAILYLAPAWLANRGNVCAFASAGCLKSCLNTAGRGKIRKIQAARIRKTQRFFDDPEGFKADIIADIATFQAACAVAGVGCCVRLNGTSDIAWERLGIMDKFPLVQFYDYTKSPIRALQYANGKLPANYHLTFSRSESNELQALEVLTAGASVAVVFSGELPQYWHGFRVIDGDKSDLRFLDGNGIVVGLKAKGDAKRDVSGFVVHANANASAKAA